MPPALQKRVLNASRGPAVWALRAQTDNGIKHETLKNIVQLFIANLEQATGT